MPHPEVRDYRIAFVAVIPVPHSCMSEQHEEYIALLLRAVPVVRSLRWICAVCRLTDLQDTIRRCAICRRCAHERCLSHRACPPCGRNWMPVVEIAPVRHL